MLEKLSRLFGARKRSKSEERPDALEEQIAELERDNERVRQENAVREEHLEYLKKSNATVQTMEELEKKFSAPTDEQIEAMQKLPQKEFDARSELMLHYAALDDSIWEQFELVRELHLPFLAFARFLPKREDRDTLAKAVQFLERITADYVRLSSDNENMLLDNPYDPKTFLKSMQATLRKNIEVKKKLDAQVVALVEKADAMSDTHDPELFSDSADFGNITEIVGRMKNHTKENVMLNAVYHGIGSPKSGKKSH